MIALILSSILVCVYALMEAADDFKQILNDEEINHKKQWLTRAALVATYLLFCGDMWWIIGLGGLFSAVFRYALNGHRGLDWRYVSASNLYDRVFLSIKDADNWLMRGESHGRFYRNNPEYLEEVHQAGRLAYIVEILAFLGTAFMELFA